MTDSFEELLDRLDGVRRRGDQADARCPIHGADRKPSLSVARGEDGRVLITCHAAGCSWRDVLLAVGMEPSDAFGEPRIVREYTYTDAAGQPLFTVERWSPKSFRQRLANGTRRAPRDSERVIYNLPAIEAVRHSDHPGCFYVEGEKDVETLANLGYAATTTLGGANKPWQPQYTEQLAGLHVVIVADNDTPGRRWAHTVAEQLNGSNGTRATVVVPPSGYKDVSDLIEAGGFVEQLVPLPSTIGDAASAVEIPVRSVEWLWPGRLPAHMLTLLEGDPGTGKSTLAVEMIACLTTGKPFPGENGTRRSPVTVAVLADEDNWSVTVVPRLKAAGADLHRVWHLRGIRDEQGFLQPYSLSDLPTLRHDVHALRASVLVIDPLVAYLGNYQQLDTHKDAHVRSVLGPLVQVAEEDAITILAIRHFTKSSAGQRAIYRGGGSIGFSGQARAVLQTTEHPDQENNPGQYVLAVAKCNLAPLAVSLGYRLVPDSIYDVSRVAWDTLPVPLTAQQLHAGPVGKVEPEGRRDEARDWLAEYLDDGEPHTWEDISAAAKLAGISPKTAERVRYEVAVRRIGPRGNRDSMWISAKVPTSPLPPDTNGGEVGGSGNSEREADYRERAFKDDTDSPLPLTSPRIVSGDGGEVGPQPEVEDDREETLSPELTVEQHKIVPEPVCRICGSTSMLTYPEPIGGRCSNHDPGVWSG